MMNKNIKIFLIVVCTLFVSVAGFWLISKTLAIYIGPQGYAPSSPGVLQAVPLNANGIGLKYGDGTYTFPDTRFLIHDQVSTYNPFRIYDPNMLGRENVFLVDNRGGISIGVASGTVIRPFDLGGIYPNYRPGGCELFANSGSDCPLVYVAGRLLSETIGAYNIVATGTITAGVGFIGNLVGGVNASYVSPGVFGSLAGVGVGNYAFPGRLGVGTNSQVGLVAPMVIQKTTSSVFGGIWSNPWEEANLLSFQSSSQQVYSLNMSPNESLYFMQPGSAVTPVMSLFADGTVGIGTLAGYLGTAGFQGNGNILSVGGSSLFEGYVTVRNGKLFVGNASSPTSTLSTAATTTLAVYSGNVGIGTSTPAYKLSVAGDVNITGAYLVNGVPLASAGIGTVNRLSKWTTNITLTDSSITDNGTSVTFALPISSDLSFLRSGSPYTISGGKGTTSYLTGGSLRIKGGDGYVNNSNAGGDLYLSGGGTLASNSGNILMQTESWGRNVGIGTTAPGARLEVVSASASAIRIKKTSGVAGSVDLFVAVSITAVTPAGACTAVVATAQCLSGWNPAGTANIGCAGTAAVGNRALCADWGD